MRIRKAEPGSGPAFLIGLEDMRATYRWEDGNPDSYCKAITFVL